MKKNSGFSLIELLITIGIVGVLVGFGLPSLQDFIKNDRLSTQINLLVGHMALARSEAVKRHVPVIICSSNNQATCGGNWDDGWIVFADLDSSGGFTAGEEELLRVQQQLEGDNTLASGAGNIITYDARGFTPDNAGTFDLCDSDGGKGRSISLSNTGRVSKEADPGC